MERHTAVDPACARIAALLHERVDGTLDAGAQADLDAHLASCAACRDLCNISGALGADGEPVIEREGEPMLDLARWVADLCLDLYPGRYIHLLVYGPTSRPPKRFDAFPPNVLSWSPCWKTPSTSLFERTADTG